MANLTDYTLQQTGIDWAAVLSEWAWLLPPESTVWLVNRFGDLFLVFEDGSVNWLDVGGGTLQRLAGSREHFARLVDEDDNANLWLMIPLVDDLVRAGIQPGPGECYSYVQPPVLGGDYTVANTCILSIQEHFTFFGHFHNQIKDLPDGTSVVFERSAG